MANRSEKVSFTGSQEAVLAARLDLPPGEPIAYALFAHCFTCSKDLFPAARISGALAERGIAVLRFDFTGLGSSEGEFANTNFSSNVDDIVAAARFLRERYQAPKLLVGHSLGGAAVLAAAPRVPEAVAVATVNAPADPAHVVGLLRHVLPDLEATGEARVTIGGRSFRLRKQFLDDLAEQNVGALVRDLRKALLVFHAPRDQVVDVENARRIFEAARHPKSFVSLDDADHLLTRKADAMYVGDVLAAWVARYLGTSATDVAPAPPAAAEPGAVMVMEAGDGKYAQQIHAGRHTLRADEPVRDGGGDSGPSPYDLLLASLGACTAMTIRMYADRKGWPLERVAVHLSHGKVHAVDCAECETKTGRIDRIERVVTLAGQLDAGQRARLLEIAERCPVHRTLQSETVIRTRLEE
jgi:putative redox protein